MKKSIIVLAVLNVLLAGYIVLPVIGVLQTLVLCMVLAIIHNTVRLMVDAWVKESSTTEHPKTWAVIEAVSMTAPVLSSLLFYQYSVELFILYLMVLMVIFGFRHSSIFSKSTDGFKKKDVVDMRNALPIVAIGGVGLFWGNAEYLNSLLFGLSTIMALICIMPDDRKNLVSTPREIFSLVNMVSVAVAVMLNIPTDIYSPKNLVLITLSTTMFFLMGMFMLAVIDDGWRIAVATKKKIVDGSITISRAMFLMALVVGRPYFYGIYLCKVIVEALHLPYRVANADYGYEKIIVPVAISIVVAGLIIYYIPSIVAYSYYATILSQVLILINMLMYINRK